MKKMILGWVLAIAPTLALSATPVSIVIAKKMTVTEELRSTGTLEPMHTAVVSAQTNGRITSIDITEGEHITEGQILARITNPNAAATKTEALANLSKAEIAYKTQKDMTERVERLVRLGTYPAIRLTTEKQKLSILQADLDAASRNANTVVDIQNLADVTSPVSGIIQEQKIYLNTVVDIGTPLFVVAFGEELKAVLPFSQNDRPMIKEGMPVRLHLFDESNPLVIATISGIQPIINQNNRSFNVFVKIKKPADWYPGMSVIGVVESGKKEVIVLPQSALVIRNQQPCVYIVDKNYRAKERPVTIKLTKTPMMWVLAGLTPGERVVVSGASELANGRPVVIQ